MNYSSFTVMPVFVVFFKHFFYCPDHLVVKYINISSIFMKYMDLGNNVILYICE